MAIPDIPENEIREIYMIWASPLSCSGKVGIGWRSWHACICLNEKLWGSTAVRC